jgi:drug/metabolite transporter (DMT)-like permease
VSPDIWKHIAMLINLATFFFAFSAFSVGLYIAGRVKAALGRGMLARVVDAFLLAAAGLTLRTFLTILAQLNWMNAFVATAIGDLALLIMAAGLFLAYLAMEKYFKRKESKQGRS